MSSCSKCEYFVPIYQDRRADAKPEKPITVKTGRGRCCRYPQETTKDAHDWCGEWSPGETEAQPKDEQATTV